MIFLNILNDCLSLKLRTIEVIFLFNLHTPFSKMLLFVLQISYVASTATTVDQTLFPTLFSVNLITKALNPLRIEMMRFFGWTRVGTIANQDDMSTSVSHRSRVLSDIVPILFWHNFLLFFLLFSRSIVFFSMFVSFF